MADHSIAGVDIGFYVRDYGTTGVWKRLVCEETLDVDFTSDVNTTKTKCGVFKGFLIPDCKISGSGVANSQPVSTEISHDEITTNMLGVTKKEFRIQDVATSGSVILIAGQGNFSQQKITFNNGDTVKFTYTFEATGDIESHES